MTFPRSPKKTSKATVDGKKMNVSQTDLDHQRIALAIEKELKDRGITQKKAAMELGLRDLNGLLKRLRKGTGICATTLVRVLKWAGLSLNDAISFEVRPTPMTRTERKEQLVVDLQNAIVDDFIESGDRISVVCYRHDVIPSTFSSKMIAWEFSPSAKKQAVAKRYQDAKEARKQTRWST